MKIPRILINSAKEWLNSNDEDDCPIQDFLDNLLPCYNYEDMEACDFAPLCISFFSPRQQLEMLKSDKMCPCIVWDKKTVRRRVRIVLKRMGEL